METKLYSVNGEAKGECQLPDEIFNVDINTGLVHQVVVSYLRNQRQGTAKTKGRSEVSGGGRKPFKQKGTGRARAGSNTSPVWVRGGKAFGANPRDYVATIPKKMKRNALCSAYSAKAQDGSVYVLEGLSLETPKTKTVADLLAGLGVLGKKCLLVINSDDKNLYLSSRNIKDVTVRNASDVSTYDVVRNECLIFSSAEAVEKIKEVVKK